MFTVNEIREKYLAFFESKGHLRLPSFPLVPQGDNSLLLINAGMTPLKPYFTGQAEPPKNRLATCQKCVRTVDIDDVGRDARHVSFFQMLGNFSFGDYFKTDAIAWAWEFLTEVVKIPPQKLSVSVYHEDDEAYKIWAEDIKIPAERIHKLGKADNFWEHGNGPCGPCSEIFFDRGEKFACDNPNCGVGCDCDRFMEVWNLVFTQFNRLADDTYEPLQKKSIDTGMGLERLAVVLQEVASIHDIDTFAKLHTAIKALKSESQKSEKDLQMSVNIIADHVRSITFMAADGVLPANDGRGYILRRLLRRAIRHAKLIGNNSPFIADLLKIVIAENAQSYAELADKQAYILEVLTNEETRFFDTLDTGMVLLEELCSNLKKSGKTLLSGEEAFRLYDTYGFPPELTKEILQEQGFSYDEERFQAEMLSQRTRARDARTETNYMGASETIYNQLDTAMTTEFVGYTTLEVQAKILAIVATDKSEKSENSDKSSKSEKSEKNILCESVKKSDGIENVVIFLDKTPFYAESGGQKGDTGTISTATGTAEILDCVKVAGGKIAHIGVLTDGELTTAELATATVHSPSRLDTAKNHTATHLLNAALRLVLGSHVEQAGSEVSAERLRFDFTHFAGIKPEELRKIEDAVNFHIFAGHTISVSEMSMKAAREAGAVMLMGEKGEKYGETVRVVNIGGGASIELCGGTHLTNTSQAGLFKIVSEGSVAAGVRRIEGLTGQGALNHYRTAEQTLAEVSQMLKTVPEQAAAKTQSLLGDLKQARQELEKVKSKMAAGESTQILENVTEQNGLKWLSALLQNLDTAALRTMGDQLKEKVDVLLLASVNGGAVQFISHVSQAAVDKGVNAGKIVKQAANICGGNGGGRANSAQAGGKDAAKAQSAVETAIAGAMGMG